MIYILKFWFVWFYPLSTFYRRPLKVYLYRSPSPSVLPTANRHAESPDPDFLPVPDQDSLPGITRDRE